MCVLLQRMERALAEVHTHAMTKQHAHLTEEACPSVHTRGPMKGAHLLPSSTVRVWNTCTHVYWICNGRKSYFVSAETQSAVIVTLLISTTPAPDTHTCLCVIAAREQGMSL